MIKMAYMYGIMDDSVQFFYNWSQNIYKQFLQMLLLDIYLHLH